jgi:peptide/nickel transport system substrate-binding protein
VPERATLYAEALAAQLADAGIRVTIEPIEEGPYYDPATPNNWLEADFAITPWGDRPSPQFYLIESLKTDARWNESHFSDEELDTLIDQAGTTQDPEERAALYGEIQRILIERGPLLISYFTAQFAVTASSVTGINLHPFPGRTNFNGAAVG